MMSNVFFGIAAGAAFVAALSNLYLWRLTRKRLAELDETQRQLDRSIGSVEAIRASMIAEFANRFGRMPTDAEMTPTPSTETRH
jgi:hypothetical protein